MGAFGTFNPNRDPMRNAALSAQFTDYENKRNNVPVGCFSDYCHSAFFNMINADPAVRFKKLCAAKHMKSFAARLF